MLLNDSDLKYLTKLLIKNSIIDEVDLSNNKLTNSSEEYLLFLLEKNKKIKNIKLDRNNLTEDTINKINKTIVSVNNYNIIISI